MIRKLLLITGIAAGVVIVALVGVRLYLTDARLTAIAQKALKDHVPFPVAIGGIELSLLSGIVLKHIVVGPPTPVYRENVAVIDEVRVGYSLGGLLKRQLKVTEVTLDHANVVLEKQGDKLNVQAMGDAFASTGPVQAPASAPAAEDDSALPITVDIEKVAVIEFAARMLSPELNASVDHINIDVRGSYAGDKGNAVIGLHAGTETEWSHVTAAIEGQGAAELQMRLDCAVNAPSLQEAHVDCRWRVARESGKWAGFDVPSVPIELGLKAQANLLTQTAAVDELTLIVGKAVAFDMALKAREILGDPEIGLDKLSLRVGLAQALQLVPQPFSLRGFVTGELAPMTARLSALQAQQPFDGMLTVKATDVTYDFVHQVAADLVLTFKQASGIDVALQANVGHVAHPAATIDGVHASVNTVMPWSVLKQQLEAPLVVHASVGVAKMVAAQATVDDVKLRATAKVYSLRGDKLDADVQLDVAQVAAQGVAVPVTLRTQAEVRGSTYRARNFSLTVADVLTLALEASITQRPKDWLDVDVTLTLADLPLARLAAITPPDVRAKLQPLQLQGSVAALVRVKGPVNPAAAYDIDKVTTFTSDTTLSWKALSLVQGPTVITDTGGKLVVHTQPSLATVALDTHVKGVALEAATLRDVGLTFGTRYEHGAGAVTAELSVAETRTASVALPLLQTALTLQAHFERGGELEVKRLVLRQPSVGLTLDMSAKVQKFEQVGDILADPTLRGLQGALAVRMKMAFPGQLKPTAGPLIVTGGMGLDLDASLNDNLVKTAGALRFDKLGLTQGDLVVKNLRGSLPFVQDVRLVNMQAQPVFSSEDILRSQSRVAYYRALRSYGRDDVGLRIENVTQGRTEISNIALNGRVERGMLLVDHFGLNTLGGDVGGTFALQASADKAIRLAMSAEFSDLDVSVLSKTTPGPDSQINGNMQLKGEWTDKVHEIDGTELNLTTVGRKLLVETLRAQDPEGKDEARQKQIGQIEFYRATIKLLKASVIHNTLNVDMDYGSIADVVGWKPIPSALVKRMDLSPYIEQYAAPAMNDVFASLGWAPRKRQ